MEVEIPTRATAPSSRYALWNHVVAPRCRILYAFLALIALYLFVLTILGYRQATEISVETTTLHGGVVERWPENFKGRTMYVLGDSTVASGNFEFTVFPYGVDLPLGSATTEKSTTGSGKFSNGYTITDYAAKDNGSPIPVPYRSLGKEKSSDSGVNFASGGCGILDWTHPPDFPSCTSLSGQIQQLFDLDLDSSSFRKAVFFISVGGNDYQFSFRGMDPEGFANELVTHFKSTLKSLYARGARKFLINNVGPIGCIPNNRNRVTNDCNEEKNHGTEVYNGKLELALRELVKECEATFVLANSQEIFKEFLKSPSEFGLIEITEPCCGKWNPKREMFLCFGKDGFCKDRKHTLFFDGAHTTDEANRIFVERCFTGSICHQITGSI